MINMCVIEGNLAVDPELKYTPSGIAVCEFAIMNNSNFKLNGEYVPRYFKVKAWRNTAEYCANYLSKGDRAVIQGEMEMRSWTTQEGNKRTTYELVATQVSITKKKGTWKNDQKGQDVKHEEPEEIPDAGEGEDPFEGE